MTTEEKLKKLIIEKFDNIKAFSEYIDLPYTTVRSILDRGVLNAKMENILKICDGLGIRAEELIREDSKKASSTNANIIELTSDSKHSYNYFDAGLSAGVLTHIDPFMKDDIGQITLSDAVLGKYAGDRNIFISYINGESMNRIIPNNSLIAVKKYDSFFDLQDGDIVVFQDDSGMAVKRFYNDKNNNIISFLPDSNYTDFKPINYSYENMNQVRIIGKVVVYTVQI